MTRNIEPWPRAAGDPALLARETPPPDGLEDRIAAELVDRRLIRPGSASRPVRQRQGHRWLALAASLVFLLAGLLIGRMTAPGGAVLTGADPDLYALLLFETDGYREPQGDGALAAYGEYSAWVAEARGREQFVAGEDLEAGRGWVLSPAAEGADIRPGAPVAGSAPLSGLFFVRADSPEQALDLARSLPHLRHGGSVVVQKTLPTANPPGEG